MQKNNKYDVWDLIFACLGGLFFTHIILGAEKINPFYTNWLLLPGSDYSYHYLAWEYFKDSPWSWPIGKIEGYAYPMYNSVMYTDSIPLFAFIFKLFRNILPPDFQYFGIWYYLCYFLNGYLGLLVARQIGFNRISGWLISIFFFGAVVLVARFGHAALCGQWLIVWCLYIYCCRKHWSTNKLIANVFSIVIAGSLIHPYLLFMVFGLGTTLFFQLFKDKLINWKKFMLFLSTKITLALFGWYISGAFLFKGQLSEGLGKFSANLNTFINAWDVGSIGPRFNYFDSGQGEGIGYLGIAVIALFGYLVIRKLIFRQIHVSSITKNYFLIACILFFIFSLGPKWTLGNYLLIDWGYNDYISRTFRGTGRFIWPLYYYILYWTFYQLHNMHKEKKWVTGILVIAILFQAFDLRPIWTRNKFVDLTPDPLPYANEMKALISKAGKVIVYPPYTSSIGDFGDYIHFVNYAQHFKKPISTGYGARFPADIGHRFRDSIADLGAYLKDHPFDLVLTNVDSLSLHIKLISELGGRSYQFERYRMYVTGNFLAQNEIPIDTISYKTILSQVDTNFVDFVIKNTGNYLFGVVHQEGTGRLSVKSKELLKSFGSNVDSVRFGNSWLFGIHNQSVFTEKYSDSVSVNEVLSMDFGKQTSVIKLLSSGHKVNGHKSAIQFGDIEFNMSRRGLNLLIVDSAGTILDQVNFDTYISDQFFSK